MKEFKAYLKDNIFSKPINFVYERVQGLSKNKLLKFNNILNHFKPIEGEPKHFKM